MSKKQTFIQGIFWNYISLVLMLISGLLLNVIVIFFYDANTLGIFNSAYAYYAVLSQIAVWGIHMSVVRYIPEFSEKKEECSQILMSALVLVTGISLVVALVVMVIAKYVITKRNMGEAILSIAVALIFFSINKVLLAYINGLSEMKVFAVFQSLRNIFIAMAMLVLAFFKVKGTSLSYCFLIGEVLLFIICLFYFLKKKYFTWSIDKEWLKRQIIFGTKIFPSNMVLEINTKIDILCLGILLNDDKLVGIYSFAIMFANAFYQVFVVIRRSINPHISRQKTEKISPGENHKIVATLFRYCNAISVVMGFLVVLCVYIICIVIRKPEYLESLLPLGIICVSIGFNAKSIIFGNTLSQLGFPTQESLVNMVTVIVNVIFNVILIYFFKNEGAAIATGISYFVFSVMLHYYLKKKEYSIEKLFF